MKIALESLDNKLLKEHNSNVSEISYRKVANTIKTMYNQNISPQGVWNVVQTVGTKIKDIEERKIELNEKVVLIV